MTTDKSKSKKQPKPAPKPVIKNPPVVPPIMVARGKGTPQMQRTGKC